MNIAVDDRTIIAARAALLELSIREPDRDWKQYYDRLVAAHDLARNFTYESSAPMLLRRQAG